MKPGGGKAKGAAFERMICKRLSLWVSDGIRDDLFWRSAISGGRATVQHRKGHSIRQVGDICAVAPEGHVLTDRWYIECKHVKKLALDSMLILKTGLLSKFWAVTVREARKYEREPILIAKQNGWPMLIVCYANALGEWAQPILVINDELEIHKFADLMETKFHEFHVRI